MPRTSKKKEAGKSSSNVENGPFFLMHPDKSIIYLTDYYYNGIYRKILPKLKPMITHLYCNEEIIDRMALCLAAYFEDQVSELGLWAAFVNRYHELYGRWLPWYDTDDDYNPQRINLQDVKFLLWIQNVSTDGNDFTPPNNPIVEKCSVKVFELLQKELPKAPENDMLVETLISNEITEDFYTLKQILMWLSKRCYLMAIPTWDLQRRNKIYKDIDQICDHRLDESMLIYDQLSYECTRLRVGPLALYPKEWLVMLRQQKGVRKGNDKILAIDSTPFYPFIVVSNNKKTITLRSCRGVNYKVDKDSFGGGPVVTVKAGCLILTTLACYKGNWGINGLCSFLDGAQPLPNSKEILKKMGESLMENDQAVDFFSVVDTSIPREKPKEMMERAEAAVAQNNGNRFFYFPNIKAALKWYYQIKGEKAKKNKGFELPFGQAPVFIYVAADCHMQFSSMVFAVKDPSNPYYDPQRAYEGSVFLYDKDLIPDEEVAYMVKHNYLTGLSFDEETPQPQYSRLIEDNLQFWATFMRQYPC